MLASNGSTRTPGLYSELISRETEGVLDEKTEHAIQTYVPHLLISCDTRLPVYSTRRNRTWYNWRWRGDNRLIKYSVYQDHSAFAGPHSTGTADLRQVLIAHSIHSSTNPTPTLALIAGMLLIHCVAEDAFWLLDGLAGSKGLLRGYISSSSSRGDHAGTVPGETGKKVGSGLDIEVDSAVFIGLFAGSEKQMSKKFKELGLHRMSL